MFCLRHRHVEVNLDDKKIDNYDDETIKWANLIKTVRTHRIKQTQMKIHKTAK